jgi:prepilin-type N-terminal cleavage/methylation domain-containing protein
MIDLRQHPRSSREAGFTLVELIIAIMVITVGVLGISGGMATMMRRQDNTAMRADMAAVADSKFEDLRGIAGAIPRTVDTLALVPGGSVAAATAGYNDVISERGRNYVRLWAVTVGVGGARQVILRVQPQVAGPTAPPARDFVTLITM